MNLYQRIVSSNTAATVVVAKPASVSYLRPSPVHVLAQLPWHVFLHSGLERKARKATSVTTEEPKLTTRLVPVTQTSEFREHGDATVVQVAENT